MRVARSARFLLHVFDCNYYAKQLELNKRNFFFENMIIQRSLVLYIYFKSVYAGALTGAFASFEPKDAGLQHFRPLLVISFIFYPNIVICLFFGISSAHFINGTRFDTWTEELCDDENLSKIERKIKG